MRVECIFVAIIYSRPMSTKKILNRLFENFKLFLEILGKFKEQFEPLMIYTNNYYQVLYYKIHHKLIVHISRVSSQSDANLPVN